MTNDTLSPFRLPAARRKTMTDAFDGGLVLLREAERRLGLAGTLAGCTRDRHNSASLAVHTLSAMLRQCPLL